MKHNTDQFEQEIEDYFVQLYTSRLGSDHYSRPLTDAEQNRLEELTGSYEQEAVFPEKVLTMIPAPDRYRGKGVAFARDSSTFFLPENAMSDEELLQIIDFLHRREYSLQTMNEKLSSDEVSFPEGAIRQEKETHGTASKTKTNDAAHDPDQGMVIPYTGTLKIQRIAAGQDCLYLMGKNEVHRMAVGSSSSELFFDDFETDTSVSALYEDKNGTVYLALNEQMADTGDSSKGVTIAGRRYQPSLWILDTDGTVTRKVDLTALSMDGDDQIRIVRKMVVDDQGYIYLRVSGISDALLIVLDGQGNFVKKITDEICFSHDLGGLGIGRDGTVYTQVQTEDQMGIASVDLRSGTLDDIYMGIVPDGRIIFGDCTEYRTEGEETFRIPEKICFYYQPAIP